MAMVYQTYTFLLHTGVQTNLLLFVFFSTISSYSFHWFLTAESVLESHRIRWLTSNRYIHVIFLLLGLAGAGIYFFKLIEHWPWLLLSAVITFLYSAPKIPLRYFRSLRKVALGKTIFLAGVWMYVTTILPIVIPHPVWQPYYLLFILSRFFLIYAICILFDQRDREDDKAAGIRSLITYLNAKQIFYLFVFSLLIFAASTAGLFFYGYSLISILILLLPGIITAFLYRPALTNYTDMFYYFVLDGLMALSAIIMMIPGFN
jgi:4-hydroxybenzoate polyprenyltransferase